MKRSTVLLLSLFLALSIYAQTGGTTGNLTWQYTPANQTLTITGVGAMPNYLSAPHSYPPWYEYCQGISKIAIGEGVTHIGTCAFDRYYNVSLVSIPTTLKTIGFGAFRYCRALGNIYMPSVNVIGDDAFYGCENLSLIACPELNQLNDSVFHNTAWYNAQPEGEVYIASVFYNYKGVIPSNTTLTLREGTVSVAGYAFSKQEGLKKLILPNSVKKISPSSIHSATGLQAIELGDSIYKIGEWAFLGSHSLEDVVIPASVTEIEPGAFFTCASLTHMLIPHTVTKLGKYRTFHGCSSLQSVILPAVTELSDFFLSSCNSLTDIYIDNPLPQKADGTIFKDTDKSKCTVYVPEGSGEAYRNLMGAGFKNITEVNLKEVFSMSALPVAMNPKGEQDKEEDITIIDENIFAVFPKLQFEMIVPESAQWLTVSTDGNDKLVLSATPNDTGQERSATVKIWLYKPDYYQEMEVVQAPDLSVSLTEPSKNDMSKVWYSDNNLHIETNKTAMLEIYSLKGELMLKQEVKAGVSTFNIKQKALIVKLDDKTVKISH